MKSASPRALALYSAGILSLIITMVVVGGDLLFYHQMRLMQVLLLPLCCFAISYFVIIYIINRFIYEKIRVVYKTIQAQKGSKKRSEFKDNENILDRVQKDVEGWAKDRKEELDHYKAQEQYRREFIGNIAHELKTPIFNIQGYVHTLLDGGLEDPDINHKYLLRTDKSIERLISVVEDLDTITRLEVGTLKLEIKKLNIVDLAKEIMDMMEIKAKKHQMKIQFGKKYEKPILVKGDKDKLKQVFINLIDNATKYGKEGGKIEVRFFDMDKNILIEIADDGPGIAQEHLPRLFERFYRVDKSRARDQGGTGLGLAIVKHIIEAHDQTINVRSTEGVGTTFSFTLEKKNVKES